MKYGYLFYQKPIIPEMPSRPINLGDPIQSYAVELLYREMGIKEEDIVPVPRYDLKNYRGEECICVINTCTTYEELAYDSYFMPPSDCVHAIPLSLHIHRNIPDDELEFYKRCKGVGCRDEATVEFLKQKGVDAYLSGCLTLTFPRRTLEQEQGASEVYFVDVQDDFRNIIPYEIRKNAVDLSSIHRFKITHSSNRMTFKEAEAFHQMGKKRIQLLRDTARLVITSRLHVAAPCLAMGIPVIMTKHDDRFGFIDRFLESYTVDDKARINWNPKPLEIEEVKKCIKNNFFARVRETESRILLENMWKSKSSIGNVKYEPQSVSALEAVKFPDNNFKYAILGVISNAAYYVVSEMSHLYPNAQLVCGIDSYVKNDFCGVRTIHPSKINELEKDVIIITSVPAAYESARENLVNRPFIFLKGKKVEIKNM